MNPVLTALLVSLDTREKLPIGAKKKQTEHSCHLCLVTLVDVNYCVTSGATLRHINGSNVAVMWWRHLVEHFLTICGVR